METNTENTDAQKTPPTRAELYTAIIDGLGENATDLSRAKLDDVVRDYLCAAITKYSAVNKYNLLVLFDESRMAKSDADNIYSAITKFSKDKSILLTLYSDGGSAAAAYLIGKLCREHTNAKFIIGVPRRAKSAATLLACAADEIHMGALSELGPIDPQIDDMPALGLKNSVEHIAELVKLYPASSDMFARYLSQSLDLINLGYYERVAESAMHYAERLLSPHQSNLAKPALDIAKQLVYGYKDHGFVIDKGEALGIFGDKTIISSSEEYDIANTIYQELKRIAMVAEWVDHSFYFIGTLSSNGTYTKKQKKSA